MDKKPGQPRWPGSCWKSRGSDEEQKAGSVTGDVRESAVGLEKYEREKSTGHSIRRHLHIQFRTPTAIYRKMSGPGTWGGGKAL